MKYFIILFLWVVLFYFLFVYFIFRKRDNDDYWKDFYRIVAEEEESEFLRKYSLGNGSDLKRKYKLEIEDYLDENGDFDLARKKVLREVENLRNEEFGERLRKLEKHRGFDQDYIKDYLNK